MQEKPHKRVGIYKEKIIININYIHTINISMLNHISIKRSLLQGKKKTKEKNKNKYKKKWMIPLKYINKNSFSNSIKGIKKYGK